jgi:hypothetical protein
MLFCGFADKESLQQKIFTIVYRNDENQYPYIKRCVIEGYIIGKPYSIVPDKSTVLRLTTRQDVIVQVKYVPNPRLKIVEEGFPVQDFLVKSVRASGVRLAPKPVKSVKLVAAKSAKASAAVSGNGRGRAGASSAGTRKKSPPKGGSSKASGTKRGTSSGSSSRSGSTTSKKSGGSSGSSSSSKRTRGGGKGKKES